MQYQIMVIMCFPLSTWFVYFTLRFNFSILPLGCLEFCQLKDWIFLMYSHGSRDVAINLILSPKRVKVWWVPFVISESFGMLIYILGYFIRLYLMHIPIGSYYWSMVSFITHQTPCQRHVIAQRWIQHALKHNVLTYFSP